MVLYCLRYHVFPSQPSSCSAACEGHCGGGVVGCGVATHAPGRWFETASNFYQRRFEVKLLYHCLGVRFGILSLCTPYCACQQPANEHNGFGCVDQGMTI